MFKTISTFKNNFSILLESISEEDRYKYITFISNYQQDNKTDGLQYAKQENVDIRIWIDLSSALSYAHIISSIFTTKHIQDVNFERIKTNV